MKQSRRFKFSFRRSRSYLIHVSDNRWGCLLSVIHNQVLIRARQNHCCNYFWWCSSIPFLMHHWCIPTSHYHITNFSVCDVFLPIQCTIRSSAREPSPFPSFSYRLCLNREPPLAPIVSVPVIDKTPWEKQQSHRGLETSLPPPPHIPETQTRFKLVLGSITMSHPSSSTPSLTDHGEGAQANKRLGGSSFPQLLDLPLYSKALSLSL